MKKLLSLLSLLLIAVGAWAADYYTPSSAYTQGDAVIYATVSTNEPDATAASYEVGAFVDGVCIGHAEYTSVTIVVEGEERPSVIYVIRARGNEDLVGKTIEFRAYNPTSGLEFALTPSEDITFQLTGTYGLPAQPVTLTLKAATSYTLADIEVEVGKSVNLLDYLTMTPSDATLPLNIEWGFYEEPYDMVEVDGNTLTGVYIGSTYIYMRNENLETLARAKVNVVKYATAINIVTDAITVNVDDGETLTAFMRNKTEAGAYELTPSDATNQVYWQLKNDGIIEQRETDSWYPVMGGTTQIRPYFINKSGKKVYPAGNKWITVTVNVPLQDVYFAKDIIYANVGDDIYQRLLSLVKFDPEDATNQNVTFSTTATSRLTITGTSAVVKSAGSGTITVTSEDGSKTASIKFRFYNPLKEVTFSQNPIYIDKNTPIDEAESGIAANIVGETSRIQNGKIEVSGVLSGSGTFDKDEWWTLNLTNTELKKGTATVTVTCGWQDFSTDDNGILVWGTPKSFIVNIGVTLNGMTVTVTPDSKEPTKGVITLTPDPTDADINWADFPIVVNSPNEFESWDGITITDNGNGSFNYTTVLPGMYTIQPVGGSDPTEFEVPYKATQASGWQWCSNPWGKVTDFKNFFGARFNEARTFADLLINDPSWGLFGTMLNAGIKQDEMYKLKMNGAHAGYLYSFEDKVLTVTLQPGWNWVGSPYFYNRLLSNAIQTGSLVKNMVIASKSDGSAEWDGTKWTGNLKAIKKGQGYLIYNPGTKAVKVTLNSEMSGKMAQGNEDEGASGAPRHGSYEASPWQYDHTLFADNMTMVAAIEGITDADRYTIGAFVGGECRGEGELDEGLAFITVHVNGSEPVTFRIYDTYTGDFFDIDQTLTSQTRLGSLDAPVRLTSQCYTDGIHTVHVGNGISGETFDANGRRLNGLQRGMNIVRQADGTVRKVMVK